MRNNKLPIVVPPEEDEYIYSYMFRLGKLNGFVDMDEYIFNYIADDIYDNKAQSKHIIKSFLGNVYFANFYKSLDIDTDPVEFYLSLTLYPCLSLFMQPYSKITHVDFAFRSRRDMFEYNFRHKKVTDNQLLYCPICEAEQIKERGFFWFQRAHQLPGVETCHKHACGLYKYTGPKKGMFMIDTIIGEPLNSAFKSENISYASFVHHINNADYQISYDNLRQIGYLRYLDIKGNELTKEEIVSCINNLMGDYNGNIDMISNAYATGRINKLSSLLDAMIFVFLLFGSIDTFEQYIKDVNSKSWMNDEYAVVGKYRDSIARFRHKCGHEFIGTSYGIDAGIECPECLSRFSDEEYLKNIIKKSLGPDYLLENNYQNESGGISVRHLICNCVRKMDFSEIIAGRDCKCLYTQNIVYAKENPDVLNNTFNSEETQRLGLNRSLKNSNSDFEVLHYKGARQSGVIKHLICGNEFSVSRVGDFFSEGHTKCPICNNKRIIRDKRDCFDSGNTENDFIKQVQSLVGDDYELIDKYKNSYENIRFRHKLCGQVFKTSGSKFLHGHRCSCEVLAYSPAEFVRMATYCTDGYYKIEVDSYFKNNQYFQFLDKETGQSFVLSKREVLQELKRPTPSNILNNEHRHAPSDSMFGRKQNFYKEVHCVASEHSDINNNFSMKDILPYFDCDKTKIRTAIRQLKRQNIAESTDIKGIYHLLKSYDS